MHETQKPERQPDAREELVFSGLALLADEIVAFRKSAADSLPLDRLREAIVSLTEMAKQMPKPDYIVIRKVVVEGPPGLEREVAELTTALRDAGFNVT